MYIIYIMIFIYLCKCLSYLENTQEIYIYALFIYSLLLMEKKLIALDLYDTCFEIKAKSVSYDRLFSALHVFDKNKKRAFKQAVMMSQQSIGDILSQEFPDFDFSLFLTKYNDLLQQEMDSVQLFPETQSTLASLRERWYKLAAVSNLAQSYIQPLELLLPHTFDYEVLSCNVGYIKPNPKIFECLQNISWYTADEIVMVGDSIWSDVQWAQRAGISAIHIERNKNNLKKKPESLQISSLSELLDIFPRIS